MLAGVRRDADAESLVCEDRRIEPVMLDVRDDAAIRHLRTRVESDSRPLAALINNAGALHVGTAEAMSMQGWREQFEVNLFGPVALAKAMLPSLRQSSGRLINVSSIGGKIVMPCVGVYQASKFALEAFSDAARMELAAQGIPVIVIEPGGIRTPIWDKSVNQVEREIEAMSPEMRQLYADQMRGVLVGANRLARFSTPPEKAAKVILRALTARRPKARYLVGIDARVFLTLKWILPDRWFDRVMQGLARSMERSDHRQPVPSMS